jgi:competence protein ComEC
MLGAKARGLVGFAAMAGSVLGTALQLQQPALWKWAAYAGLMAGALAAWLALQSLRRPVRGVMPMALLFGAIVGAGLAGWRATAYADGALPPALEGRDVQVIGVVDQLPQRGEGMVRFEFEVETAEPPDVPRHISLSWYAEGSGLWGRTGGAVDSPGPVHAGERWRMTVRLRAPHGNLNPHGFDQELRLWEQGVHAHGPGANRRPGPAPRTHRRHLAPSGRALAGDRARRCLRARGGPAIGRGDRRVGHRRPERDRPMRIGMSSERPAWPI